MTAECGDCHKNNVFSGTPNQCVGCHGGQRPAEPDHTALPETCQACHNTAAWKPAALDHEQFYPLTGKHVTAECGECHKNGQFSGTPNKCIGCHGDQRPLEPDHSGLPEACQACHTTSAWLPAALNHDQFYPLTGKHVVADCAQCHPNGRYAGTANQCVGCHAQDKAGAADPPHDSLPDGCSACHSTAGWRPAALDHDQFFPLQGQHATAQCEACHVGGRYDGTPTACIGCHADDKARADVPPHGGFPDTCQECHTAAGWSPADFDHAGFFPLVGRHAQLPCAECHEGGRYAGTPRDCIGCHAADKAGAQPSHAAYPNTCTTCHTQNAWTPATYNHRFPVPHRTARQCAQCHLDQSDFGNFSCIDCHEHNQASMNRVHQGEAAGYQWNSQACYRCHPTGRGD